MCNKKIQNRDYIWIIGILVSIIILLFTWIFASNNDKNLVNVISIGSGLVSIALAFIAIAIAIKQDSSATQTNIQTQNILNSIDNKINNIENKFTDSSKNFVTTTVSTKDNIDKVISNVENLITTKSDNDIKKELSEIIKELNGAKNEINDNIDNFIEEIIEDFNVNDRQIFKLKFGFNDEKRKFNMDEICDKLSISRQVACKRLQFIKTDLEKRGINIDEIRTINETEEEKRRRVERMHNKFLIKKTYINRI